MNKNRLGILLFLLLCTFLQTIFVPSFFGSFSDLPIFGRLSFHTIDFFLIVLLYLSFQRELWEALVWSFVLGLLAAAFGEAWGGSLKTTYLFICVLASLLRYHILARNVFPKIVLFGLATLVAALIEIMLGGVFLRSSGMFRSQSFFIFEQMLINAFFAPVIVWSLLQWDRRTDHRRRLAQQSTVFGKIEEDQFALI